MMLSSVPVRLSSSTGAATINPTQVAPIGSIVLSEGARDIEIKNRTPRYNRGLCLAAEQRLITQARKKNANQRTQRPRQMASEGQLVIVGRWCRS
jgi:hypothetical protein